MNIKADVEELQKIRDNCKYCVGTGYKLVETTKGIRYEDCRCIEKISRAIIIAEANIPKQYKDFDLRKLKRVFKEENKQSMELLRNFIAYLPNKISHGKGLWFAGPPGTAKSSIICYILLEAIKNNYSAFWARSSHMMSLKFEALKDPDARDQISKIINNVKILALEEIDKVYLASENSFQSQIFFEFLSDVHDANISLLLSSNEHPEKVLKDFPSFMHDRLATLVTVPLLGSSGRLGLEED